MGDARADEAARLLLGLLRDTGVTGGGPVRRYLWTDAFAVRTLWALHEAGHRPGTDEDRSFGELALAMVDQVHEVLGSFRPDDARRSGRLSGLEGDAAETHPTAGGLRIGKPLPERPPGEPVDPDLEWERDGQYFHYLTRWMRALLVTADVSGDPRHLRWSVELALAAHEGCVRRQPDGTPSHIAWKSSVDLSRAAIDRPGLHDPLDGYLTYRVIEAAADDAGVDASALEEPIREMASLAGLPGGTDWTTGDPLGLGGLMLDLHTVVRLSSRDSPEADPDGGDSRSTEDHTLATSIADAIARGLVELDDSGALRRSPARRLPFRDLGLSLGVRALLRLRDEGVVQTPGMGRARLDTLLEAAPEPEAIETIWRSAEGRAARTWAHHLDINRAMLAASLLPDGVLRA